MNRITKKFNTFLNNTYFKTSLFRNNFKKIMKDHKGEGFVDTALKILISVVVDALLLAGLYLLFNETILPTFTERIKELFDYKG